MHQDQDNTNESPFFSTPSNSRLVQQISHLAEFGSNVIIVEGVEGIGKTRFAVELSSSLSSHQSASLFVHIEAEATVDSYSFLSSLCQQLGVVRSDEHVTDLGENLAALRSFVQQMIREHKLAVVIIDDADKLDSQVLGALLSVIQTGAEVSFGLHFVFMALPNFSQRIDSLCVLEAAVHDFQLPPLSQVELERFILERYPAAQDLFEEEVVTSRSLWVRSQGIPGAACQMLERELTARNTPPKKLINFDFVKMPLVHLSVGTVLLGALILMFFMRTDKSESESVRNRLNVDMPSTATALPLPVRSGAATDDSSINDSSINEMALNNAEISSEKKISATDSSPGLVDIELSKLNDIAQNEGIAIESAKPSTASGLSGVAISVVPSTKPEVKVTPSSNLAKSSDVKAPVEQYSEDERTLMSLPASSYVLQILAASQVESLQGYIANQPNKDALYIYRGLRQGKSWYMVVLAPYSSKAEALAAIKLLPKLQAKAGPWPKSVSSVQSEINVFKNK